MATIPKIDRVGAQDIQGLQGVDPGRTNTSGLDVAGKAIEGFGQTVTKDLANDLAFIGAQNQMRDEDRIANEASNALKSAYIDRQFGSKDYQPAVSEETDQEGENVIRPARPAVGTPGWSTLRGSAAVDAQQDILTEAKELHEKNLNTLSGRTLDLYREKTSATILAYEASVSKHVSGQRDQAEIASFDASVAASRRAFILDPTAFDRLEQLRILEESVLEKQDKLGNTDPESRAQAVREQESLTFRQAIETQLNTNTMQGAEVAKNLFEEAKQEGMLTTKDLSDLTKMTNEKTSLIEAQAFFEDMVQKAPEMTEQEVLKIGKESLSGKTQTEFVRMAESHFRAKRRGKAEDEKKKFIDALNAAKDRTHWSTLPASFVATLSSNERTLLEKTYQASQNNGVVSTDQAGRTFLQNTLNLEFGDADDQQKLVLTNAFDPKYNLSLPDRERIVEAQNKVRKQLREERGEDVKESKEEMRKSTDVSTLNKTVKQFMPMRELQKLKKSKRDKRALERFGGPLRLTMTQFRIARDATSVRMDKARAANRTLMPTEVEAIFKEEALKAKGDSWNTSMQEAADAIEKSKGGKLPKDFQFSDEIFGRQIENMADAAGVSVVRALRISAYLRTIKGLVPTTNLIRQTNKDAIAKAIRERIGDAGAVRRFTGDQEKRGRDEARALSSGSLRTKEATELETNEGIVDAEGVFDPKTGQVGFVERALEGKLPTPPPLSPEAQAAADALRAREEAEQAAREAEARLSPEERQLNQAEEQARAGQAELSIRISPEQMQEAVSKEVRIRATRALNQQVLKDKLAGKKRSPEETINLRKQIISSTNLDVIYEFQQREDKRVAEEEAKNKKRLENIKEARANLAKLKEVPAAEELTGTEPAGINAPITDEEINRLTASPLIKGDSAKTDKKVMAFRATRSARGEVPPRPSTKPALPNWETSTRERNKIIKFWSKNYQSTNNPVKEKRATKDLAAWLKSGNKVPKSAVSDIDVAASIFEGDKGMDKQTLVQIAEAIGVIESGFKYTRQGLEKLGDGRGVARSYWMVEPKTALSLVKNSSGLFKLRNKKSKFEQEFEAKYAKPARFDEDGNVMDGTALEYLQSLSEAEMGDVLQKDGKLAATLALAKVVNRQK